MKVLWENILLLAAFGVALLAFLMFLLYQVTLSMKEDIHDFYYKSYRKRIEN
jgi:hypothetical protein